MSERASFRARPEMSETTRSSAASTIIYQNDSVRHRHERRLVAPARSTRVLLESLFRTHLKSASRRTAKWELYGNVSGRFGRPAFLFSIQSRALLSDEVRSTPINVAEISKISTPSGITVHHSFPKSQTCAPPVIVLKGGLSFTKIGILFKCY